MLALTEVFASRCALSLCSEAFLLKEAEHGMLGVQRCRCAVWHGGAFIFSFVSSARLPAGLLLSYLLERHLGEGSMTSPGCHFFQK